MLALDGREAADAAADVDARPARRSTALTVRPESFIAKSAAATANWMKRSIFLTSFFSTQFRGSKPLTSPAKCVEWREASKRVMGATPRAAGQEAVPGGLRFRCPGARRAPRRSRRLFVSVPHLLPRFEGCRERRAYFFALSECFSM